METTGVEMPKKSCLHCAVRLLPLLLLILATLAQAQDYTYTTNNGTLTLTKYAAQGHSQVTIPSTINGLPVTSIGDWAFAPRSNMTKRHDPHGRLQDRGTHVL